MALKKDFPVTAIEAYIREGSCTFTIGIWDKTQRVPAQTYIDAAKETHPGIEARIVVTRRRIDTGKVVGNGSRFIRYHFSGRS